MVEASANQASQPGDADDEEPFVFSQLLSRVLGRGIFLQLAASAIEISLQNVSSNEHAGCDHEAEGGNGQGSKMQERDHRRLKVGSNVSIHDGRLSPAGAA